MHHAGKITAGSVALALVMGSAKLARNIYLDRADDARRAADQQETRDQRQAYYDQRQADLLADAEARQRASEERFEAMRRMTAPSITIETPDWTFEPPPPPTNPHRSRPQPPVTEPAPPDHDTRPAAIEPERTGRPSPFATPPGEAEVRGPGEACGTEAAEPVPAIAETLELEHSPRPTDDELAGYATWEVTGDYDAFLGNREAVGAFSLRPSMEFSMSGTSARRAEWNAPGGTRGVGLELRVEPLRPREAGLTSPVIEDGGAEGRSEFRLGRQARRVTGAVDVRYQVVDGLLVWRIDVPASANTQLAACYYAAIVDGQMVVLSARYDKVKPEQLAGFDAMVATLRYEP